MIEYSNYRRLAQAVILQATLDYYYYIKNRRYGKKITKDLKAEGPHIRRWVGTGDFKFWCEFCELDYQAVAKGFGNMGKGKRISELDRGGRKK
jgi:hypothetical protein